MTSILIFILTTLQTTLNKSFTRFGGIHPVLLIAISYVAFFTLAHIFRKSQTRLTRAFSLKIGVLSVFGVFFSSILLAILVLSGNLSGEIGFYKFQINKTITGLIFPISFLPVQFLLLLKIIDKNNSKKNIISKAFFLITFVVFFAYFRLLLIFSNNYYAEIGLHLFEASCLTMYWIKFLKIS